MRYQAWANELVFAALARLPEGALTSPRNPVHCPPLADLATAQREMDRWYVDYAERLPGAAPHSSGTERSAEPWLRSDTG